MKYLKTCVVTALAAAALLALPANGSATTITVTTDITSDTVTAGAEITATLTEGTEAILKSAFIGEVKCSGAHLALSITNAGSLTTTVSGDFTTHSVTACNASVTTVKSGTFEIHTTEVNANGNGILTSSGTEFTTELAGLHCIYSTSNTQIAHITGTHTGHVHITSSSAAIPRTGGRSGAFCGSSATWTAGYTVTGLHWTGLTYTNFTID
jgi:hypothetical protein